MSDRVERDLVDALRAEAYREPLLLDARTLRQRLTRRPERNWNMMAALVPIAAVLAGVALVGALTLITRPAGPSIHPSPSHAACSATRPTPPFAAPSPFPAAAPRASEAWYGSNALWTMLNRDGEVWHQSGDQKLFWWSKNWAATGEPAPAISVTLTRLDGAGSYSFGPGTNATSDDLGGTAMLVGVNFPGPGCWRVTAHYRGAALSYVVWIVSAMPSPAATPATVILPDSAPLKPSACGWPATTPLAFAGWATVADLDAEQIIQGNPLAHVYALVSRDAVELRPNIGPPMSARGFCALRQDGAQTESGVPNNWTVHGAQQQPMVTCSPALAISCVRATLVVLDAIETLGHPVTRIIFHGGPVCIPPGEYCALIIGPAGTKNITTAFVSLAGTDQQAFLHLFWLANGSISTSKIVVAAPQPGASPFS